jgi:hypothetical protein
MEPRNFVQYDRTDTYVQSCWPRAQIQKVVSIGGGGELHPLRSERPIGSW